MSQSQPGDDGDTRIPAHVLTGFLGSGKTTLLRRWLADPGMADTLVVINEFGEIGLDHLLVGEVAEDVVLLSSGCLCCAVRDDLVSKLVELYAMMRAGQFPAFSRAVIETTGMADPAPIMQSLMCEPSLSCSYRPGQVVTTVDGIVGDSTLASHREARSQLAMADCVVITKNDLIPDARRNELGAIIASVNPEARILVSARNESAALELLGTQPATWSRTRNKVGRGSAGDALSHAHVHDDAIGTFTARMPGPVVWDEFVDWLELLLSARGDSILRVKGLVEVRGEDGPLVVQGVQHVLYPCERLRAWPDSSDAPGWIVFIARDLSREAIERSLRSLTTTIAA